MYLIKTEFVKLRRCNILWVGIITLLCAPLLSILQQQSLNDPVDNYGYVNLVNGTIWNNMSFFLPVTLMLLGGYMISREYTDDTLKEIFIIPLSYSKLMAGKIGALLILSVFYSFYSFVLTTGLSILFYPIGLTGIAIIKALLQICGMGLCITDSNLNHTGIYLYSKGKIMIHLTFDYKTDEKCTTPGQYLKYHRTFQGLSTRELAEKVGIVPATLVLYENDRHPIKHSTAVALANALGIDRNRLLDKYTAFVDYPYSSLLKKVRQDLSLTQIQMAELIGIGQTSYSGWEREIRVPRRKEYDKILAALEKLRVNVDTYLCQSASI